MKALNEYRLELLDRDELLSLKINVEDDLRAIKGQISKAKARAYTGDYSDREWWVRVNDSLRHHQSCVQRILAEICARKRIEQKKREKEWRENNETH